jgi:hypothetical protein
MYGEPNNFMRARTVSEQFDPHLDQPIWHATPIAETANIRGTDGKLDLPATYYKLAAGLIDADKVGGVWCSTRRRILNSLSKKRAA